jgi:hypothetical protein
MLPEDKYRSAYIYKMMEHLGIEPNAGVVPCLSLLYAAASHRCASCPSTRACDDWLDHAPASASFSPPFCMNRDILSELQLRKVSTYS